MPLNAVPEIALLTKKQAAAMVKDARLKKPLTQKELAERAGISIRSLQRIENADVLPRNYTWRQLAANVDLLAFLPEKTDKPLVSEPTKLNDARKWILSFSAFFIIILSFSAYVLQSPSFPETKFETCLMLLTGCITYATILYHVWK
ncbi:transcriptional regulator with XRE-family HTH domain [Pedobacter sp. UYP30]|uniref:helix-turn-helix domain-containing protein n=1 Tax=Pedobacter sp. UYP30 TaxID=1756400 RepID=UPI003392D343